MMKLHDSETEEPALVAHAETETLIQNSQKRSLKFSLTLENQPAGNVT